MITHNCQIVCQIPTIFASVYRMGRTPVFEGSDFPCLSFVSTIDGDYALNWTSLGFQNFGVSSRNSTLRSVLHMQESGDAFAKKKALRMMMSASAEDSIRLDVAPPKNLTYSKMYQLHRLANWCANVMGRATGVRYSLGSQVFLFVRVWQVASRDRSPGKASLVLEITFKMIRKNAQLVTRRRRREGFRC